MILSMTISQFFARTLKKAGINKVFGIPSYVGLGILKALDEENFDIVLNTHEQNAAHAAEGYFYATNKPAILSIAIGPGITNAATGIANAYIESIPMIVAAARPYSGAIGRNEYHANSGLGRTLDEKSLLKSCCKQVFYIDNINNTQSMILEAIRTCLTGRPGPVYVSIPPELQEHELSNPLILNPHKYLASNISTLSTGDINLIQEEFEKAKKPIIIIGSEVSQLSKNDLKNILKGNCPYLTTYGAKGKVPILDNYLGTIWYANSNPVIETIKESDLILAIGEEFSFFSIRLLGQYILSQKIIQICNYPEEVGKVFGLYKGFTGDVNELVQKIKLPLKPWLPKLKVDRNTTNEFKTLNIIRKLGKLLPDKSVIFADVGNAGYASITDFMLQEDQRFFTTGKFGVCGWSIPSSIGYSTGNNQCPTFTIVGDLSFLMNLQEIANVKKLKTKNNFIVFKNKVPQNITKDQIDTLGKTIQSDLPDVNYEAIARGFGLEFTKFKTISKFESFFKLTNFETNQYIIELDIESDDYPLEE